MDNQMERRWLSLFVENRAGVLARISGLFSGKAYNLHSLTEKLMAEIFQMAEVFRFLIKDMGKDSLLIEAIRTETKNDSILKVFKERYTNIEVVRGGPVAIDCISMQDR